MTALAPGHPDTIDGAPMPVARVVTEQPGWDAETVTLDLAATSILGQLARAIVEAGAVDCLVQGGTAPWTLGASQALWRLADLPGVRAALTLTLDPGQADSLAGALVEAATHQRCLHSLDGVEYDCDRPAVDADGKCVEHTYDGPCCAPHRACHEHAGRAA